MPPRSRYAGLPIDTSSRHSVRIVDAPTDGDRLAKKPRVTVDYVFHEQRYWRATIPLDGVDQVFGQAFNFSKPRTRRTKEGTQILRNRHGLAKRKIPILHHLQCRIKFRPDRPVQLTPIDSPEDQSRTETIDDLIYSLEAVGPPAVKFNLRDGMTGSLVSAHRVMSTEAMVFERLVVESQEVTESPALPLNDEQCRRLLAYSLVRSHQAGMSEVYYLYRPFGTNNCTSSPFQILDHVVDYGWRAKIGASLYRLPLSPRFYLRVRGMDTDPSVRKLVRTEFEGYINDPRTQQLKSEFVRARRGARGEASDTDANDGTPHAE